MTPEQTASRLDARKTASGWQAKCPAHEDKHASLSIAAGDSGNVLLKCHAGCEFLDIVRAANLEPSDLFPETDMAEAKAQPRRIVAEYNYRNAEGELSYQVVRYEPKDFRQRKPENGGWDWSIKGCLPVLYRLPELLAAPKSEPVFIVEGEKDADALAKLGLIATTNAGGAAKWNPAYNRQLAGRLVVILPDNDEPGRKHADIIAGQVKGAQVIHLPGLPPKGDVSDWLAGGGTSTALKALISTSGFAPSSQRMRSANDQRLKNIKRILPYNVSYLDDELLGIHPNDIVIIMAATGAGKTTLGSILAQKAAEDGKRIRFFALEAYQNEIEVRTLYRELSRISEEAGVFNPWMTQQKWIKRGIKELEPFVEQAISNLEKRLGSLETYYRATKFDREDIHREFMACKGQVDLIILDHLHYVDSDGPNENVELKKVVQVIRDCGQALGVPVIVIAHIRKKTGGRNEVAWIPTTDDLHGSSDVTKIATTIVAVAPARDEDFVSQEPGIANTFMSVLKDRIGGDKGYAALMRYDLGAMQYRHHYRLCTRLGNGKVAYVKKNPGWANNALPPGGAQESTQTSMGNDDDF